MDDIQDGWQHVQVENWPRRSGIHVLLQVFMLTLWVIEATKLIVFNNQVEPWTYMKVSYIVALFFKPK